MTGSRVADESDIASAASSRRHADSMPYVHKVGVPPKQSFFKEFKFTFKETFFHDNPLRPFKDHPRLKQLWLGIQAVFPILEWGRRYELSMFKGDLIAGITIASLCIPQVLENFSELILTVVHSAPELCHHGRLKRYCHRPSSRGVPLVREYASGGD
ncbi:UNVERIFIED_CONTAM: Sulfate transporter 1.3 [Sesamum radiatum]|uniref:Sulfate transporter 1.3 n=1 Tax=Sesamum radiatum TaxID=300843 RepID=A0AAW2MWQ8_SESRA